MGRTKRELERRIADAIGVIEDEDLLRELWFSGSLVNRDYLDVGAYMYEVFNNTDAWPFVEEFVTPPSLDLEEPVEDGEGQKLVELVLRSFYWADTEQGPDYWNEVYRRLKDRFGGPTNTMGMGGDPHGVRRAADLLRSLFSWEVSMEGFDYWSNVHYNLCGVADRLEGITRTQDEEPDEELTEDQIRLVEGVARSFHWGRVPQGFGYWDGVYLKLRDRFNVEVGVGTIEDDPERVQETADLLLTLFEWRDTEEGEDYWAGVHDNLLDISFQLEKEEGESEKPKVPDLNVQEGALLELLVFLVKQDWCYTRQGEIYWEDVYYNLVDILGREPTPEELEQPATSWIEAQGLLVAAFAWHATEQGEGYWAEVFRDIQKAWG